MVPPSMLTAWSLVKRLVELEPLAMSGTMFLPEEATSVELGSKAPHGSVDAMILLLDPLNLLVETVLLASRTPEHALKLSPGLKLT